ncbi:MAG TPA: prepilin-type N-terminal cleavage/methylation domain-containing protein [Sedimentisphaerales bacterium]|jgi:prepilin-type N-terminal cleavage/methylation domain-containing protein|nr:prepilin-type N-terminal cleavage/methylation domain-containing protein [Sedimentisphaerales bacterium]HNU28664.1 prepilin-type N-terminal cleavage/methylation domain-containing protein [Sedimentisphaerales bacterium]
MTHRTNCQGFTLIEVLIATLLVGLAIAGLVGANSSFTMANAAGTDMSTAEFLAEQIRELTAMLPVIDPQTKIGFDAKEATWATYDDLDDFDNFNSSSLGGPISATRTVLTEFSTFSQEVTVQKVSPSDFDTEVDDNDSSAFLRVSVVVRQNGRQLVSASWIRANF